MAKGLIATSVSHGQQLGRGIRLNIAEHLISMRIRSFIIAYVLVLAILLFADRRSVPAQGNRYSHVVDLTGTPNAAELASANSNRCSSFVDTGDVVCWADSRGAADCASGRHGFGDAAGSRVADYSERCRGLGIAPWCRCARIVSRDSP